MAIKAFMILLLIYSTYCCLGQEIVDISKYLEEYKKSPSISVLIYKEDRVIHKSTVGYANYEMQIPSDIEYSYAIASISKQFVAAAILQLQERGQLNLDDSIDQYFSSLNKDITIKNLLEHSSGISDVFMDEKYLSVYGLYLSKEQRLQYIFDNISYNFLPGEKYEYCNTGYTLLSIIIEKVSSLSFSDYLEKNIFEPLSMNSTHVGASNRLIPYSVRGYNINQDGNFIDAVYLPFDLDWVLGAGNCYSSAGDIVKWIKGLEKNKILSEDSKSLMLTQFKLHNGDVAKNAFGFSIYEKEGVKLYKKSGAINGFQSNMIWVPAKDIIVVGLTNRVDAPPTFVYEIAEELIK